MGKRSQEAAEPSLADSPAHQAAVVPWTVLRSFFTCLSPKPSRGPAIVPSEWTASVETVRSNSPGVPSAASSAPSPLAIAAASLSADESCEEIWSVVGIVPSFEPTQSEDLVPRLEETFLRDSMAQFDPSVNRFLDRSSDQFVSTSSDLNNDPTLGRGSNLAVKKFIENEGGASRICDTSANEVKTGTMDTGNAVVLSSFKAWQKTRVLPPFQRKREKSKNQWLLRRCLEILTLQRDLQQGIQTHEAVSQRIGSQGPLPTSSGTSMPHRGVDKALMSHMMMAERRRRTRQKENFAALGQLLPAKSKPGDKASILGDAIVYLKDLQEQIHELEARNSQVERQYEDLKLSHEALEQRFQQLEDSKSQVGRQYEDLKLSHEALEQRNQQPEGSIKTDEVGCCERS